MLGMMLLLGLLARLFFRFVIWAIFVYLRDPKGLRKYPLMHPLSGISDIPFMLESMRGFRSATLLQLHYGQGHPVIRLGPNALSFAGGQAIPAIYGHNTPATKDRQYLNAAGSHFHLADVVDKKEHARKRKVLASAFAAKHLEDWEYKVADKVQRLMQRFDQHLAQMPDDPLDYRSWTNLFTIDSLCDTLIVAPTVDIFAALMEDPAGNPQDLEWGEVLAEISLAISGSSSTSNSIASTMKLLIEHPEKMRKLQEEVDSVMATQLEDSPDGDTPTVASYDQIKSLPYLRAVIDESLRLYPPISHGLPRETPKEGMMIMDQWVPGNTTVSVSAYVAHRDPAVFDQPESFVPERWLGEQGRALQTRFIAFSAGARGCIGRPISYLQASILLANLVHQYDFEMWDPKWKPSRRETMNLIMGPMPSRLITTLCCLTTSLLASTWPSTIDGKPLPDKWFQISLNGTSLNTRDVAEIAERTPITVCERTVIAVGGCVGIASYVVTFARSIATTIKDLSNGGNCNAMHGTFEGLKWTYYSTGRNCDTTAQHDTIAGAIKKYLNNVEHNDICGTQCLRMDHGGTWDGWLKLAPVGSFNEICLLWSLFVR
ncbi:hypothetical protein KXW19_002344 [Aspergillus fumigatus]|nr:hypothetical protein CNMCM8689_006964 [Aspergillus fumigatus]KAH1638518.1 hypothetical protein KXX39_005385 [Aspergillus fumigatus]KAH1686188.1 hypothetical protein KXX12_002988 [Aspergillus fumigatus]KAH1748823.1 hypothetical protein KXX41_009504 [Aspergillus fumigatus]KAH1776738.1 hypothetical protein KXX62_009450 [Aspergillus fumigatus]